MFLVSAQKGLFLYDGWIQCVSVLKKIFRTHQHLREKAAFRCMSLKLLVFVFKQVKKKCMPLVLDLLRRI